MNSRAISRIILWCAVILFIGIPAIAFALEGDPSTEPEFSTESSDSQIWLIFGPENEELPEIEINEIPQEDGPAIESSPDVESDTQPSLAMAIVVEQEHVVTQETIVLNDNNDTGLSGNSVESTTLEAVPEPSTLVLLGLGILVAIGINRRKKQKD